MPQAQTPAQPTLAARFLGLLRQEEGQALTSNASFLAGLAVVGASAYYFGGEHVHGFVTMIMSSPPPGTDPSLFR